jgi:hypothetical protein
MHELGDAVVDDAATLSRILAHVEEAAAWATAISGAPTGRHCSTATPTPSTASPPARLHRRDRAARLLYRHFTYDDQGNHFAKWAAAGRDYPANVGDAYRAKAIRESVAGGRGVLPRRECPRGWWT